MWQQHLVGQQGPTHTGSHTCRQLADSGKGDAPRPFIQLDLKQLW